MLRVLAFTVKPEESADTRYRVVQFVEPAARDGVRVDHRSFMGARYFRWQIKGRNLALRMLLYPFLFLVRLWQVLFLAPGYDCVLVAREMAPLGPPLFEWLLVKLCKRVVFDIDDALHLSDKKMASLIPRLMRDRGKFSRMAGSYGAVICGSENLAAYYRQFSAHVRIIPTVVDVARYASTRRTPSDVARIGWIGTPLNSDHLALVYSALKRLAQERYFELVLVGLNHALPWELPAIRYMEWRLADELSYFAHFDIGIMPLRDSPFARGKCAFKLVQYMAAGIPVVASPVGANCQVVEQGRNGYLAETAEQWHEALGALIDKAEQREAMGDYAQASVRRSYSIEPAWADYRMIFCGESDQDNGGTSCAR